MKNIGLYSRVQIEMSGPGVISQAGGAAPIETIRASGLGAAVALRRKPMAIHDPAKVITDLAVTLALGGDCLADIALPRAEASVLGLVASDLTVSRTIDALTATRTGSRGHRHGAREGPSGGVDCGRGRCARSPGRRGERRTARATPGQTSDLKGAITHTEHRPPTT